MAVHPCSGLLCPPGVSTQAVTDRAVWAAASEHQSLGGLHNKHLFLMVLEAETSKIKAPAELVPGNGGPPLGFIVLIQCVLT